MPEPEQLGPGSAGSPGPATDGSRQINLEPEQRGQGGYARRKRGADPVWLRHCEHTPVLFICSIPPYLPSAQLNNNIHLHRYIPIYTYTYLYSYIPRERETESEINHLNLKLIQNNKRLTGAKTLPRKKIKTKSLYSGSAKNFVHVFSVRCCRKMQMNFLANLIFRYQNLFKHYSK